MNISMKTLKLTGKTGISHSVSLLVTGSPPGDTRGTGGVSAGRGLEAKRVWAEIPSRLLPTDPGVRYGKLGDVTGVLNMANGGTKEVSEGFWTEVSNEAGDIRGSHSMVRVQGDWADGWEACGD